MFERWGAFFILLTFLVFSQTQNLVYAESAGLQDADQEVATSPKSPWGDFTVAEDTEQSSGHSWVEKVLLWIPNRVLDAFDIFRVDVGAGPAFGAVARISRYGQIGYRQVAPFSLRVGAFGRNAPFLVETSNEFGIGPGYISSRDRKVCKGEIGLGADFIVGAYLGFCAEEVLDFVAGVFFLDVQGDDIK